VVNLSNPKTRLIVICSAIIALGLGGFGYFVYSDMQRMDELEAETSDLDQKIRRADADIRTIPTREDEVLILRERVKEYVTILPDDSEINAFVDKLAEFERSTGIVYLKLDDAQARARTSRRGETKKTFEDITYKLNVLGTTEQLLAFLDEIENRYDRFVRITKLTIKAHDGRMGSSKKDEGVDLREIVRQHSVDIELETYVYNPKKGGADVVQIKGEAQKLERIREEGRLDAADEVALVRYEIERHPGRRDPFVDPRIYLAENSSIPDAERRHQLQVLDDLKGKMVELQGAISKERVENVVTKMQIEDANNQVIAALYAEVRKLELEKFFSVPEYVKEFDSAVVVPMRAIAARLDGPAMPGMLPEHDVENRVNLMTKAMEDRQYGRTIELYDEIVKLLSRFTPTEELQPMLTKARSMHDRAKVYRSFDELKFAFGGCIIYSDDPGQAVIIIDGRSFGPGEVVGDSLMIKAITQTEIVFNYQGLEVSRRHGEDRLQ
jgi:Tfp pilus assembly protein PilO